MKFFCGFESYSLVMATIVKFCSSNFLDLNFIGLYFCILLCNLFQQSDIAVVKNIPEVNAILWKIKHLVKITPIQCPNGLPEEGDYEGTYLTDYGEFRISPRLKIDPKQIEATEEFVKDPRKFDGETLRKLLRLKWLNGW